MNEVGAIKDFDKYHKALKIVCSMCKSKDKCPECPAFTRWHTLYKIAQMEELLNGATMSKFASLSECEEYRRGIIDCINIMKKE